MSAALSDAVLSAGTPARRDPAWAGRVFWTFAGLALLWPALVLSEFKPWVLLEPGALKPAAHFVADFFPPRTDAEFLWLLARETWRTVAMATVGLTLALLLAVPLALLSVRVLSLSALAGSMAWMPTVLRQTVRWVLMLLRSVPELVWAALMVLAVGLGPFAGVLALALHTSGVLGRLYAETLENVPADAERALTDAGSGALAAFVYGSLPLIVPQCVAYALYRWEMNIRMAAVLGFVGAGGLGQMLYFHLSIFQQAQAATVLLAMLVLVFVVDIVSSRLRRGLAPAYA